MVVGRGGGHETAEFVFDVQGSQKAAHVVYDSMSIRLRL